MRVPLQKRITKSILATFVVLALIFSLVFVILLKMQTDSIIQKSRMVLTMLVGRERDNLANEIFEKRIRAIRLRIGEILQLDDIMSVTVYDRSGQPLVHVDRLDGEASSLEAREVIERKEMWYRVGKWRTVPALCYEAPLKVLGEVNGYIKINYSLSSIERNRRLSWLVVVGLLMAIFMVMLILLNRLMAVGVVGPIERLRSAMVRVESEGPGAVLDVDREDEIGDLMKAFNGMSTQLAELLERVSLEIEERRKAQENLVQSHRIAQTLIDTTDDIMIMVDLNDTIMAVNQSTAEWFGRPPSELIGMSLLDLIEVEEFREGAQWVKEAATTGNQVRHEAAHKGRIYDHEYYPVKDADGQVVAVADYGRDITAMRQAQIALDERMSELLALNTLGRKLGNTLSVKATIHATLEYMADIIKPDQIMFFLREGGDLVLKASLPDNMEEIVDRARSDWLGKCLDGIESLKNQAMYFPDIHGDPRCLDLRQGFEEMELRSAAALPLLAGDENLGVLLIGFREPTDSTKQADFIEASCSEVAMALKNALLFERLRLSEGKFYSAFQASPDSVSLTNHLWGQIYEVNDGFEHVTGWSREEALGRTTLDLGLWAVPDERLKAIAEMERSGEVTNMEFTFFNKDKGHRQGLISMRPVIVDHEQLLISVVRDITESKKAEEDLRKSQEMLASIIRSIPDILYRLDPEGRITFINDAVKRYGYEPDDLIGRDILELVHPEDRISAGRQIKERQAGNRKTKDLTVRLLSKDDIIHPFETRSSNIVKEHIMLLDAEGLYYSDQPVEEGFFGTQGIARDITQLKTLESQLRQAQKMEAIGTLAGGIAHDFNNILMAILSNAELSKLKIQHGDNVERHIEEVLKAGLRARDLVKQILTFSRGSEVEKTYVDLAAIVSETLMLLRASIPATTEIVSEVPLGLGLVMGDPTQLHQLVLNLCTNAAYAMRHRSGKLTVKLKNREIRHKTTMESSDLPPGMYVQLEVTDTGEGIRPEVKERIFDPFFTTKARGDGTGLGLATVHGIVKEMGGSITLQSELGGGTTFEVLLPVHEAQGTKPNRKESSLVGGKEFILVVDDEKEVAEATAELLQVLGYGVMFFNEPLKALEYFQKNKECVDLVMTDQNMPGMTGLELGVRLKFEHVGVPVILMTGFSENFSQETIRNLGFQALVRKPLILQELADQVRKVLDEIDRE